MALGCAEKQMNEKGMQLEKREMAERERTHLSSYAGILFLAYGKDKEFFLTL